MTARNDRINHIIGELQSLLAPFQCIGVRTDYTVTDMGVNRRCIVPERHGAGGRYAALSIRDNIRPKGIRSLVNFLGITPPDADQVLNLALELSELNDIGSWYFESDDRAERTAGEFGVGAKRYAQLPGFSYAYQNLRDAIPAIERIDIAKHTGTRKGGKSVKGWMHFYDRAGDQVCAVSTNLLATSVQNWFGDDEAERVVADRHLGRWAHQTNADLPRFVEAAMHLLQFDANQRVTCINLKEV